MSRVGGVDIGAFESRGFTLAYVSGSDQTATVNTAFASPLVVQVSANASIEPVTGGVVTYTGPSSGASIAHNPGTAMIAAGGQASLTATANTTADAYTVTASAAGVTTAATFNLTNTPGAPASVAVVSGTPQSATVQHALRQPLVVVVKDTYGNVVPGVSVTFAAPATGGVGDADGLAGNDGRQRPGQRHGHGRHGRRHLHVTASATGVRIGHLQPDQHARHPASVAVVSGSASRPRWTRPSPGQLVALVTDAYGNPVPVSASPSPRRPRRLGHPDRLARHDRRHRGQASVTAAANTKAGSYTVTASVAGVTTPAGFTLTNTPGAPASVAVVSGSGQSATVNTAFGAPLVALVTDTSTATRSRASASPSPRRPRALGHADRLARHDRRHRAGQALRPRPTRPPARTR